MVTIGIDFIFPVITVVMSLLFFLSVSEQYIRKRKMHQLVWAISMFLFLVTAGVEGYSYSVGSWDPFIYRIYYVFAAVQVALMGAGALYLFASRDIINKRNSGKALTLFGVSWAFFPMMFQRMAPVLLLVLIPAIVLTLIGLGTWLQNYIRDSEKTVSFSGKQLSHIFVLFTFYMFILMMIVALGAELDLAYLTASGGKEVAGHGWVNDLTSSNGPRATIRLFSPLNTISGGIALIGGAFYSYYAWQRALKKKKGAYEPKTGIFNLYIGGGALVLAIGGTLSGFGISITSLLGLEALEEIFGAGILYLAEAIGVTFMYFGFLESDKITWKKLVSVLTLGWLRKKEETKVSSGDK